MLHQLHQISCQSDSGLLNSAYCAQIHKTEPGANEDCALRLSTPLPRSSLYIRLSFVRHAHTLRKSEMI